MPHKEKRDHIYILLSTLAYWVGTIVFLAILNANKLFSLLNDKARITPDRFFSDIINSTYTRIAAWLDVQPHVAAIVTFMFWLFVGIFVYGLVLFIGSLLWTLTKEQSLIHHYKFPVFKSEASLSRIILLHWVWVVGLMLLFFFGLTIVVTIFFPVANGLFMSVFYHPGNFSSWFNTLTSSLSLSISAHGVFWLARLTWRSRSLLTDIS